MDKRSTDGLCDYGEDAGVGLPQRDNHDYVYLLLPDLDYDAQLRAIHGLLRLHRRATHESREDIREIEAAPRRSERDIDEWLDCMHAFTYQDAAHSMAAVGMLAPLVESIFHQALLRVGEHFSSAARLSHDRGQHDGDSQWDCHYIWRGGRWDKDLVSGICDLADEVGLSRHLPAELTPKLQALFQYRNKMFHHGR